MIDALANRVRGAATVVSRATLTPVLVRAGIFACLALAIILAFPVEVVSTRYLAPLMLVALLPAFAPRGAAPTLAILAVVVGWVLTTAEFQQVIELWRLLALATLLYLAHMLAALAAALPSDAIVAPLVPARWLARAFFVVVGAAVVGVLLVALGGIGGGSMLLAALAGLAVAVGAAALLGWLIKRAP
jgi:hypothetical protein